MAVVRAERIWLDLERIRAEAPLVHNITNYVVMNTTANALLALGASPVMAHAPEEVAELASMARALVINIGTLSDSWVSSMLRAGEAAMRAGRPIVIDPVGAGATRFRTETARRLVEKLAPAIVRGNASEILALGADRHSTKGVDSVQTVEQALDAARSIAGTSGAAVAVSGPVDVIVWGRSVARVANGHPLMPRVTGLGCTATALCGAFAAVSESPSDAAVNAMAVMGIAGEIAAERAGGPGSFLIAFFDALYNLDAAQIRTRLRIEEG